MTSCDAEKAVRDGSYKSALDDDLRLMHQACLNANGPNTSAVDRIRKVGDIIWDELKTREENQRQQDVGLASDGRGLVVSTKDDASADSLNGWDEARLAKLVQDGVEESLSLEYKSAAALSREERPMTQITKDVSAMANSAGGLIVFGLAEYADAARQHLPERLDPIQRTRFSREWLEQVIAQIRPRISELRIYPVQLQSAPSHVAYVVEIPQGTTAHQARDFRYYRRYNFEAVPMVDHEIRDVMGRKTHPRVTVTAQFVVYPRTHRDGYGGALVVSMKNETDILVRYVGLIVHSPIKVRGKLIVYENATLDEDDEGSSYRLRFSSHNGAPLFPYGTLQALFRFKFADRMNPEPTKCLSDFRYHIFADAMPKQTGSFTLEQILKMKDDTSEASSRGATS